MTGFRSGDPVTVWFGNYQPEAADEDSQIMFYSDESLRTDKYGSSQIVHGMIPGVVLRVADKDSPIVQTWKRKWVWLPEMQLLKIAGSYRDSLIVGWVEDYYVRRST